MEAVFITFAMLVSQRILWMRRMKTDNPRLSAESAASAGKFNLIVESVSFREYFEMNELLAMAAE
ncbi:MAG: hypothetical protein AB1757_01545 [Acidobacteriota bacterium]